MAEKNVDVEGINYYTLFELPDSQDESAPCVLLTHALMSNLHMYDATVKALHAAGYSTLRFDLVGHHNTPPPQRKTTERRMSLGGRLAYHMDDLTRHMHQLVKERTGQTRVAAVVGCSIGGVLALRYAMLFRHDVGAVISIAAPGIASPAAAKSLWSQRIQIFEEDVRDGTDRLCHATVQRWLPGSEDEDERARTVALQQVKTCSLAGYQLLADTIRNYDYTDEVVGIRGTRCLVIAGSEDAAVAPETLRTLSGRITGAHFVCMNGAGHLPPLHRPEEFNKLMLNFLGSAA